MFGDVRDDEQNSVHSNDMDSGINSINSPAQVWVNSIRPLLFQAMAHPPVKASGAGEQQPRSSFDGGELQRPGLSECGPTASSPT